MEPFFALIVPRDQHAQPPGIWGPPGPWPTPPIHIPGQPPGIWPPAGVVSPPIYYPPGISGPPGPWPTPPIAMPPGGSPPGIWGPPGPWPTPPIAMPPVSPPGIWGGGNVPMPTPPIVIPPPIPQVPEGKALLVVWVPGAGYEAVVIDKPGPPYEPPPGGAVPTPQAAPTGRRG